MVIKPQWDKVLLESAEQAVSKGGIILPATAKGPTTKMYRVLALGEGPLMTDGKILPHRVAVGNMVLVQDGSRIKLETPDGDRYIAREQDCLGIIEE